ncbi:co-chaperone GroES [Streptomyces olivoreticuli]
MPVTNDRCPVRPLGDRVVVRPHGGPEATSSGLVIPETAREEPSEGTVLAVGPGSYDSTGTTQQPPDVAVGHRVVFGTFCGTQVEYQGKCYLILPACELLAIVGDDPGEGT